MRHAAFHHDPSTSGPLARIGGTRVRELAAARALLRPDRSTGDHDRVLDVVADRLLRDLFGSPGRTPAPRFDPDASSIVVSARTPGRVVAPSAC